MDTTKKIYKIVKMLDKCTVAELDYFAELINESLEKKQCIFDILAFRDIDEITTEKEIAAFPGLKKKKPI